MMQDLTDNSKIIYYLNDSREWRKVNGTLHCELQDTSTYVNNITSDVLTDMSHSFTFKMKKKQWYDVQKALGLIKPVYKKKRKGKRYVWYEKPKT